MSKRIQLIFFCKIETLKFISFFNKRVTLFKTFLILLLEVICGPFFLKYWSLYFWKLPASNSWLLRIFKWGCSYMDLMDLPTIPRRERRSQLTSCSRAQWWVKLRLGISRLPVFDYNLICTLLGNKLWC